MGRFRSWGWVSVGLATTVAANPACAATTTDLASALNAVARRAKVELIYDPAQLAGVRVHLVGSGSIVASLDGLLGQTRFTFRQVDAHSFVIIARAARVVQSPTIPPASAGPEILVTGRRSQNADLVRGKDEIQPYWITTADDIAQSGETTLGAYFNTRLTFDRSGTPLSQTGPSPRSQVNLRGFATDQTLVLIDGRRMAAFPENVGLAGQVDINAIPVEAVDRVEILATSAGGIFGIGATGGAVNIILKRDYRGIMLSADTGATQQAGGIEHRIYGQAGWTSPSGRTRLMVSGSYAYDSGVEQGQRPFTEEATAQKVAYDGYATLTYSNALNIQSIGGVPLTFTAANGGKSLGSALTYLPLGSGAVGASALATLAANAGKQDLSLPSNGQDSLIARTGRSSIIASLRQEIGDSTELFFDFMRFDDRGYKNTPVSTLPVAAVAAGANGNPFNQAVLVLFPNTLGMEADPERIIEQRGTIGMIHRFGHGWSLDIDGSYGTTSDTTTLNEAFGNFAENVFGGLAALNASLQPLDTLTAVTTSLNRIADGNIRVSGPLFTLPGGPATLMASGEFRHEWTDGIYFDDNEVDGSYVNPSQENEGPAVQNTWSVFGETRLPILPESGPARPWRGLSAQIALRLDRYRLWSPEEGGIDNIRSVGTVFASTMGLESRPVDGLILRTSYSTAAEPPAPSQLYYATETASASLLSDPQRGGTSGNYLYSLTLGNPDVHPQRTDSFSAGFIIDPPRLPGLRLAVDYTRLITHGELVNVAGADAQYFLDNEGAYPDHVVRAPLTAADAALGYTGGKIVSIVDGALQSGQSDLQSIDFDLGYTRALGSGKLHFQGNVDWNLSFIRNEDPAYGQYNLVGHSDGPLAWRANLGLDWSNPRWSIGVQSQLYAGYDIAQARAPDFLPTGYTAASFAALQAAQPHIPVQDYFDLSVGYRPGGKTGIAIQLTIDNVFNKAPPIAVNSLPNALVSSQIDTTPTSGAAAYGDVLGRRFTLNVRIPIRR